MPPYKYLPNIVPLVGFDLFRLGYHLWTSRQMNLKPEPNEPQRWVGKTFMPAGFVTTEISVQGSDLVANCNCDDARTGGWCIHKVAAAIGIEWMESGEAIRLQDIYALEPVDQISRYDRSRVQDLLTELSPVHDRRMPAYSRTSIRAQFNLFCTPINEYRRVSRMFLSLAIGETRTYLIKNLRKFLTQQLDRSNIPLSKAFTYDPSVHTFSREDREVFEVLIDLQHRSDVQLDYYTPRAFGLSGSTDRYLSITPLAWDRLWPVLRTTTFTVNQNAVSVQPLPLPIRFHLEQLTEEVYRFSAEGLQTLMILSTYHFAMARNAVYDMPSELGKPLEDLQKVMAQQNTASVKLPKSALEGFMAKVVPLTRQLGVVEVASTVTEAVIEAPLTARLFLDWPEDTLVARVEFGYGPATIDPLATDEKASEKARVVVRDPAGEATILTLLSDQGFEVNDHRFVLAEEERIFEFMTEGISTLETLMEVYATDRFDGLIHHSTSTPKARVDLNATMDWLEISFEVEDLDQTEIQGLLRSLIEKRPYHRLQSGRFLSLRDPDFQGIRTLVADLDLKEREISEDTVKIPALRGLGLLEGTAESSNVRLGKLLRRWLDDLKHPESLDAREPESLHHILRDYQRFGFQWMKTLTHYGFGGVLADDMGLGKTLQSIAFLLSEREEGILKDPALILCPASLMYNWEREFQRFAPSLKVLVVAGTPEERERLLDASSDYDVLITSYPLLLRDVAWYQSHPFHALIADEAQTIKNRATKTAQNVASIPSSRRIALTGTPVENSLDDLWSIFHAIFPELLGSQDVFSRMTPEAVAKRVRPFLLRRLKKDVLKELPDKIETVETSELTTAQRKLYVGYLEQLRDEANESIKEVGFGASRFKILAGLTRLRQICCHPGLFVENYDGESGKLDLLMEIVDEAMASNRKMLIFSQFTSMLAIIREELEKRLWPFFYLDGDTPTRARLGLTEAFNRGERPIFLISLKAGGTGLNLTGADTVLLYDLWWNPAVEEQAADRAHRIGQKNVVQVIRLITKGTIEEKMYELQGKKRDLIDRVVQANDQGLGALTEDDVRELLTL